MKKTLAFIGALALFICTCIGINYYYNHVIHAKKTELIYYNADQRNSCLEGMETVLTNNAIPVFGSSELSAEDDVAYPVSLFRNGASDYNMVLIGRGSMQSLHHAINVGAMAPIISNKKVVLILSPQWFTSSHLASEAYASRFSERMYSELMKNSSISRQTKQEITERVKTLLVTDPKQLARVEKYESVYLNHSVNVIEHIEMKLYDSFMHIKQKSILANHIDKLQKNENEPISVDDIIFGDLMNAATEAGKKACTNNDLFIYDEYYDTYVRDSREANKNVNAGASYLESPEYDDLRLFLNICKEVGIEPLIVSIPVNGRWYDWTGFSKEERQSYYQKIRNICEEAQVSLCDFSDKEYEEYFLKDIMHLGWKGWVYLDEAVYKFYKKN